MPVFFERPWLSALNIRFPAHGGRISIYAGRSRFSHNRSFYPSSEISTIWPEKLFHVSRLGRVDLEAAS